MKTTSSKLFRGVMLIAALLVPTTIWWMSLRYYNEHRQAERMQALLANAERQSAEVKQQRDVFFRPVNTGSVEFAPVETARSTWNWPTDPDGVWHGQHQRAGELLMRLNSTELDRPASLPPHPIPSR